MGAISEFGSQKSAWIDCACLSVCRETDSFRDIRGTLTIYDASYAPVSSDGPSAGAVMVSFFVVLRGSTCTAAGFLDSVPLK